MGEKKQVRSPTLTHVITGDSDVTSNCAVLFACVCVVLCNWFSLPLLQILSSSKDACFVSAVETLQQIR